MVISKNHNDFGKGSSSKKGVPVLLADIKITPEIKLNADDDLQEFIISYREAQNKRRKAWVNDYVQSFGFDFWDDDEAYDRWYDEMYGDYDYYQPRRKKNNASGGKRSLRFINGMEVDPDISDDDAYALMYGGGRTTKKHNKKSSRVRKDINTSSSSRRFQGGYIDDEDEDNWGVYEGKVYDDDPRDEEKKIIFYRALNNTADVYEWNSVFEFSDWLEENGIAISDGDAYDIIYKYETHCCLDPETSAKRIICASTYDDLVFELTGGDMDYLAEISSRACSI